MTETLHTGTIDPGEVARFDRMARDWWDPKGPMRALHRLNPVRLQYIRDKACRNFGRDERAPRPLEGLLWGEALALTLAGGVVAPLSGIGLFGRKTESPRYMATTVVLHAIWGLLVGLVYA